MANRGEIILDASKNIFSDMSKASGVSSHLATTILHSGSGFLDAEATRIGKDAYDKQKAVHAFADITVPQNDIHWTYERISRDPQPPPPIFGDDDQTPLWWENLKPEDKNGQLGSLLNELKLDVPGLTPFQLPQEGESVDGKFGRKEKIPWETTSLDDLLAAYAAGDPRKAVVEYAYLVREYAHSLLGKDHNQSVVNELRKDYHSLGNFEEKAFPDRSFGQLLLQLPAPTKEARETLLQLETLDTEDAQSLIPNKAQVRQDLLKSLETV
jgi:hypothetical protein